MGRIRSSWRQSRIQRYLTCYVQQCHLVDTQTSCAVIRVFLPGGGDKTHFMCLLLVHGICSATDKFRLMTIKLLYAVSDKADRVKSKVFLMLLVNVWQQNTFNNHQNSGCVCRQNILKWSIHLTLNSNIINYSIRLCGLSLNLHWESTKYWWRSGMTRGYVQRWLWTALMSPQTCNTFKLYRWRLVFSHLDQIILWIFQLFLLDGSV